MATTLDVPVPVLTGPGRASVSRRRREDTATHAAAQHTTSSTQRRGSWTTKTRLRKPVMQTPPAPRPPDLFDLALRSLADGALPPTFDIIAPGPPPSATTTCGSSDPPSVHPLESTVGSENALAPGLNDSKTYHFRHNSWAPTRRRVRTALAELAPSHVVSLARRDRFEDCGRRSWIMQSTTDPTHFKFVTDHCRDRFCVPCGQHRANVISENLDRRLGPGPYRFLTLTLRHSDTSLSSQLTRLLKSFRRLRQRAFFKERVTGGSAFFEMKRTPDGRRWHPHLHVILEGRYLPHPLIKAAWLDITGDSYVVDIRLVRDRAYTIWYCAKYSTKPVPPSVVRDPHALTEAIVALSGRKLINPFGPWARWNLLEEPSDDDWTIFCHVNSVVDTLYRDLATTLAMRAVWKRYAAGNAPADFHFTLPPPDD